MLLTASHEEVVFPVVNSPFTREEPAYFVEFAIRSISLTRVSYSALILSRFVPAFADAAWVASSFIRVKMSPTLAIAPSAVCNKAFASVIFRWATWTDAMLARKAEETASPAASSFAELIR